MPDIRSAKFGISVHDHIIVGKEGHASLKRTEADLDKPIESIVYF
jgi:hypothetical protein